MTKTQTGSYDHKLITLSEIPSRKLLQFATATYLCDPNKVLRFPPERNDEFGSSDNNVWTLEPINR